MKTKKKKSNKKILPIKLPSQTLIDYLESLPHIYPERVRKFNTYLYLCKNNPNEYSMRYEKPTDEKYFGRWVVYKKSNLYNNHEYSIIIDYIE